MIRKLFCLLAFSLCVAVNFSFGFTIVLKNGKTVQGTLVSENSDVYIVKDASGTQLNFSKTSVDIQKTLSANQTPASSAAVANVEPAPKPESKPEPGAAPASKKPARKFTEEDLERLREKYDLGAGMASDTNAAKEGDTEKTEEKKKEAKEKGHSEDELRSQAAALRDQIKQAQESYENLKEGCDFASRMTPQAGDSATNKKGERLDIAETRQKVCDAAETAKGALDEAREQYEALIQSAKSDGISQDWLENH